ncbi:asparaginase [Candidatus Woesearchaeota archaeon]|nr:asparaginase [Candidatus Woesearchaeota archaeon]
MQGIGKPVVLTGAQIPANQLESDARRNFVNAVKLATMNIAQVMVVFGSKVILGTRAKKVSESELEAFKTFNAPDLGEIRLSIELKQEHKKRHNHPFTPKPGFNANIIVLTLEPGIRTEDVMKIVESDIKGLVIRAYGSGDLPYSLLPALERAHKKKIPIVVTTQCPIGVTRIGLNDVGLKALQTGITQAFDMSMESMTTKLKWLLDKNTPYERIKEIMETNLAGELVPPIKDS